MANVVEPDVKMGGPKVRNSGIGCPTFHHVQGRDTALFLGYSPVFNSRDLPVGRDRKCGDITRGKQCWLAADSSLQRKSGELPPAVLLAAR